MAALVSANTKTYGSSGHAATSTTLLRRVMRFDFDQLASSALSLGGELLYDHAKALCVRMLRFSPRLRALPLAVMLCNVRSSTTM